MRRKEFGDFQTPLELAQQILQVMQRDFDTNWSRLLEPTCGHGNFIRAALDSSCHFDEIIGIEIQAEYAQRARQIPTNSTRLEIIQSNIFTFDSRAFSMITAPSSPAFWAILRIGISSALRTMVTPVFSSSTSSLKLSSALIALMSATPPPGTMPSSIAARVALRASSTRCFSFGGGPDANDGHTATQLGKALL